MTETILLVGGGGREHALANAIARSDRAPDLVAAAGHRNPGVAALASEYETLEETDPAAVVGFAERTGADLAVIGPEGPLAAGIADALAEAGVYPFGPRADLARIETDKAFQRQFMRDHYIPGCPEFAVLDDAEAAVEYINAVDGDVAVKPVGLTGGKGVRVTGDQLTMAEATEYVREREYDEWVIEERLVGEEFTVQALVANGDVRPTPAVQDHKRAYEGDEGPNTGGMGSYTDREAVLPFMTRADYDAAVDVIERTVDALGDYTGILYGQFMLTADGPMVVEFNARFGDPEAMNTLPVLETDFVDVLFTARDGDPLPELAFARKATVCKYAVPAGYPTNPTAGATITVDQDAVSDAHLFYASVDERPDGLYTTTSRSFAVVGVADTISEAEEIAEAAISRAGTGGLHVRHDIGTPDLVQRRVDHMRELRGG